MDLRSRPLAQALLLSLACGAPAAVGAKPAPRLVASFEDAAHDATGPGTYQPPGDTEFEDGDFDLRRFAVYADGEDVLFQVTLSAPFREPAITQRTNLIPLALDNRIFFQNIDIYVDTDPGSKAGYDACIPGRRVRFEEGRTWKAAVILTPQPVPARAITAAVFGEDAMRHVVFSESLDVRGRVVTVRVPDWYFGGPPRRDWAYSVHVSGATWERSFSALDLVRSGKEANAFTMPVVGMREAWAFGGAPSGEAHPRVVDVLLLPGTDQKEVLGSFNATSGEYARVPFVSLVPAPAPTPPAAAVAAPAPKPDASVEASAPAPSLPSLAEVPTAVPVSPPASPAPPPPALTVADVSEGMISVSGPVSGIKAMQIGRVVGPTGLTVARLVVIQVFEKGLVARAVEGGEKVERGAAVRFDAAGP
jgi:hypothetical protein